MSGTEWNFGLMIFSTYCYSMQVSQRLCWTLIMIWTLSITLIFYTNSTTFWKYSLLQISGCKDRKGFLLCPQGLYGEPFLYSAARKPSSWTECDSFISFLPDNRKRPSISNTVMLIYKIRMMDKLQIHTLKRCIILSSNKFKLQLWHRHINTEWQKKKQTFEKHNKNWRNPRKKIYWQKLNHYNLPFKRQ